VQGPGKSWNLLGSDEDGRHSDVDADAKIVNNCKKCSNSLFAISSQHVTVMNVYSGMHAAIHNCCLSLYLNIAGLQGPVKNLWGPRKSWKCPGIFFPRVGALNIGIICVINYCNIGVFYFVAVRRWSWIYRRSRLRRPRDTWSC